MGKRSTASIRRLIFKRRESRILNVLQWLALLWSCTPLQSCWYLPISLDYSLRPSWSAFTVLYSLHHSRLWSYASPLTQAIVLLIPCNVHSQLQPLLNSNLVHLHSPCWWDCSCFQTIVLANAPFADYYCNLSTVSHTRPLLTTIVFSISSFY